MKKYIVFVDTYSRRNRTKTKRYEVYSSDILTACNEAKIRNKGGEVSMVWLEILNHEFLY